MQCRAHRLSDPFGDQLKEEYFPFLFLLYFSIFSSLSPFSSILGKKQVNLKSIEVSSLWTFGSLRHDFDKLLWT